MCTADGPHMRRSTHPDLTRAVLSLPDPPTTLATGPRALYVELREMLAVVQPIDVDQSRVEVQFDDRGGLELTLAHALDPDWSITADHPVRLRRTRLTSQAALAPLFTRRQKPRATGFVLPLFVRSSSGGAREVLPRRGAIRSRGWDDGLPRCIRTGARGPRAPCAGAR